MKNYKVTTMQQMFNGYYSLTCLNLSSFDTLNAFLKTDVLFDFLLAVVAMHLRVGGQHHRLYVFGHANTCEC